MEKKIDEILNNFHLGKIDLIEVRKQLLILYGVMLPKGTLCVCDKCRTTVMQDGWQTQRHANKSRKWDYYAQEKMRLIQKIEEIENERSN